MSENNFEFDIDSILAEFSSDTAKEDKTEPQQTEKHSVPEQNNSDAIEGKAAEKANIQEHKITEAPALQNSDATMVFSKISDDVDPRYQEIRPKARKTEKITEDEPRKKEKSVKQAKEKKEVKPTPVLSVVFTVCFVICLVWGLFNIKPFSSSSSAIKPIATPAPTVEPAVTEETDTETVTDSGTEIVEGTAEPVVEQTKYKLEEGQMAPKPNAACYGQVSVTNAAEINNIISQARDMGLLGEDEKVAFDSNAEFNQGSYYQDIMYYLDESIMVICWKQLIDGYTLTMSEIKIADGSQFRMEVYGDIYNENDNSYLSQMVMANNAVVAMNSDKCKARGDGVLVCNRILYKYNENVYAGMLKRYNCLDNCFVTANGDMLFTKRLEEMTTEEMQQYIIDNDIVFSISFGPLLIENGEMVYGYNPGDDNYIEYAYGETEKPYSRCGMGQIDERHYLYVSLNHSDEQAARWTMREFAQHIYDLGIMQSFYGLDGGQTAELIINNTIYNHIDYGAERYTSNCIYFATAVPDGEG